MKNIGDENEGNFGYGISEGEDYNLCPNYKNHYDSVNCQECGFFNEESLGEGGKWDTRNIIESTKNKVNTTTDLSKLKNKIFSFNKLISYQVSIDCNGALNHIKFHHGKKNFICYIRYTLKKIINGNVDIDIENLEIYDTRLKLKSGYGGSKYSPNYYNYLGLKKEDLKIFVIELLKDFHSKN